MFNLTSLSRDERCTAVLHGFYGGFSNPSFKEGDWLLKQLGRATERAIHLHSAERELREAFPAMPQAGQVIERLLRQSFTTHVCLTWTRDEDGREVYIGATPPIPCTTSMLRYDDAPYLPKPVPA